MSYKNTITILMFVIVAYATLGNTQKQEPCDFENVDPDYLAGPEPVLYNINNSPPGQHWKDYDKYLMGFNKNQCKGSTKNFTTFSKESHTEDSRYRQCLLRIVRHKSNMKKFTRANKIKVGIIGAGMAGLVAGYELKHLGYDVTILEATQRIGGRAKTFRSEVFTENLHGEAGPMRFPPAHYLTFAYLQEMNLTWNSFTTAGPEALYYFTSKNGRSMPYPKKIFNWNSKEYRHDIVMKICGDFNIDPKECEWPAKRFENAMKEQVKELESCGWEHMMQKYDNYSTRTFLQSLKWSDDYITFLSVVINQENFLDIGFIEYFKDYVGQFWTDNAYYPYPNNDPEGLYTGLPVKGLHQVTNGTDALPSAFYNSLKDNIVFGALVRSIKQSDSMATVEYIVQNYYRKSLKFDFVLITLPFTVLRDVLIDPPFSPGKRQSIRELHYISATKILLQFRKAFWVKPNPLIAAEFNQSGIVNGGGSTTDLPLRAIYYPTESVSYDQRAILLAAYTWEAEADRWGSLEEGCRLRRALEYVAKIHGDQVYDLFEAGVSQVWKTQPYAGAAVSYFYPQQRRLLFKNSYSQEGRCFFAGEHTSFTHFWIHGAIQSALRAVIGIYQASRHKAQNPTPKKTFFPKDFVHLKPSKGIEQQAVCKENMMSIHQSMAVNAREYGENTRFSVMINVIKGNIYAEVDGQAAQLQSGATLYIPQGSSYMITASSETKLLKHSSVTDEMCQQIQQNAIVFKMRSRNHRGTLYFANSKRMANANDTRYLFGIGTLNRILKGYMMSYQQRTIAHVANKVLTDKSGQWMPSLLAFISSQSKPTFTAHLKRPLLNHAVFGTMKDVLSQISQYNANAPFCIQGSVSFTRLEAMDIDQRPIIKKDAKAIMTGCYIDFHKMPHVQQSELADLWHDRTEKHQSSFVLAAELKDNILTDKMDSVTAIHRIKSSSIPTEFDLEVTTLKDILPLK